MYSTGGEAFSITRDEWVALMQAVTKMGKSLAELQESTASAKDNIPSEVGSVSSFTSTESETARFHYLSNKQVELYRQANPEADFMGKVQNAEEFDEALEPTFPELFVMRLA